MDVNSATRTLLILLLLGTIVGCAKTPEKPVDSDEALTKSASSQLLVGTWWGKAQLNQQKLDSKINSLADPNQRNMLVSLSQTFRTTEIGAEFSSDGGMVLDIEIRPVGRGSLRDSTTGNWKAIEEFSDAVVIETTEHLPNGGTETSRMRYQFSDGGQVAVMVAPTSSELADCDPVFVFRRVEPPTPQVAVKSSEAAIK